MIIFDGREFARAKEEAIKQTVDEFKRRGIVPKMLSILGDNSPESELYVSLKGQFAKRVGIEFEIHHFEPIENAQRLIANITRANQDPAIHGIMVQLPVTEPQILEAISPAKDVDCLTSENLGLLLKREPRFLPATVRAVLSIIENSEFKLPGADVCIVGASNIVGKPLAIILSDEGATVTLCRSTANNLPEITRKADILISATGAPQLIKENMVKEGAMVIDVGISKLLREGRYKVVGDVEVEASRVASFITPVPGGVGPVTVACLFENLLTAING